jgi:hypothetical protein
MVTEMWLAMAVRAAWVMVAMSTGPLVSKRIIRWKPLWGHSSLAKPVAASLLISEVCNLTGVFDSERRMSILADSRKALARLGSMW